MSAIDHVTANDKRDECMYVTSMCRVSMFGKHLRKLGSILTSLKTPKFAFKAKILTLGTMELGLAFVSACNAIYKRKCHGSLRDQHG